MIRLYLIAGLILALAASTGVQTFRLQRAQAAVVQADRDAVSAQLAATSAARAVEAASVAATSRIGAAYQRGLNDAQNAANAVVADLRAGNVQLRAQWRGCEADRVPTTTAPTGSADAAEQDRRDSAGRIVRAADACDAQVSALQALVLADRAQRAVSP